MNDSGLLFLCDEKDTFKVLHWDVSSALLLPLTFYIISIATRGMASKALSTRIWGFVRINVLVSESSRCSDGEAQSNCGDKINILLLLSCTWSLPLFPTKLIWY